MRSRRPSPLRVLLLGGAASAVTLAGGCGFFTVAAPTDTPEPPPATTHASPTPPPRHEIVVRVTGSGRAGISYAIGDDRQTYDPKAHGTHAHGKHHRRATAKTDKLPWHEQVTIVGRLPGMPMVTATAAGPHKHRRLACTITLDGHRLIHQHSRSGTVSCKPGTGASLA